MIALLLVPSEAWRDRLLATGPCGAMVPMAWQHWHSGRWIAPGGKLSAVEFVKLEDDPPVALVLAWAGAAVPEGCDRAARVLLAREGHGDACTTAPEWIPRFGDGECWMLGDDVTYFVPGHTMGELRGDFEVPELAGASVGGTGAAWALATVCAARGLGEVVTVEGEKP